MLARVSEGIRVELDGDDLPVPNVRYNDVLTARVRDLRVAALRRAGALPPYDERREIYRAKGLVVHTRENVQTAEGDKNGRWTTVVAAAVFVL